MTDVPTTNSHDEDDNIQPLSEDNNVPFSQPDSIEINSGSGKLDDTHPSTDSASDLDLHEQYDAGLASAADAGEPNTNNNVEGYDPTKDQSA